MDEGDDAGGVMFFPGILVLSLGGVSKEGSVAHVARRLLVPVPRIPREIRDESKLKNPIDWRFLTWLEQILCDPEHGSMAVLGEDFNRLVPLKGDDGAVGVSSLNSTSAGRSPELLSTGGGKVCIGDLIHPLRWGSLVSFLLADPVPYEWFAVRGGRVPGDTGNDEVLV